MPTADPALYASLAASDAVMGIDHAAAAAFCSWDCGQLVSEYEWEKAARGMAPDARLNSWGTGVGGCTEHPYTGCFSPTISTATGAYPAALSPFGVRELGTLREFTRTLWANYTGTLPSDPPGPTMDLHGYTRRSWDWIPATTSTLDSRTACTRSNDQDGDLSRTGFRCVY